VTQPFQNMVIDCHLRRSTTVDMISPVARKSLILITLIAFRISRWIAGARTVPELGRVQYAMWLNDSTS
jgi:hypothetical protein